MSQPGSSEPAAGPRATGDAQIIVYTTEPCSFCRAVKALLERHGLPFNEVNLARDPQGREELARRTGMYTFPQVIVGDRPIGGFEETRALLAARAEELAHAAGAGNGDRGRSPAPPPRS
jgi:glutaredoxin 3